MNRLSQNNLKARDDHTGFGCQWLPNAHADDIYFLKNKHTDRNSLRGEHKILNKSLIFDNEESRITPKSNKISLKRDRSQASILHGPQQNNFSEAKITPNEWPGCQLQGKSVITSSEGNRGLKHNQNQKFKQSQLGSNNALYNKQKNQDKSYNYRSVISPHASASLFPQRPLLRQNSSANVNFKSQPIFIPYSTQANTIINEQQFRSNKELRNAYDDDLFGFLNQQNGGSLMMKQTNNSFNENLLHRRSYGEDKNLEKNNFKSLMKSKLSSQTNIYRENISSDVSQSSISKPRTMKHLTTMQDVEEIQSVLDDSGDADDDKQSVVLGRMTKYSSGGNLLKQLQLLLPHATANPVQISSITRATSFYPEN